MILITGDTHGYFRKIYKNTNIEQLDKNDYVIVTGDFGYMFNTSLSCNMEKKLLENVDTNILFVDGNHENFDMLNGYKVEQWHGGKIHRLSDNIIHLMRGQVFEIDNKKIFTFGGAESIDKVWRIPGISWWEAEMPNEEEMNEGLENLKKYDMNVDYIVTHALPTSQLHLCAAELGFDMLGDKLTDYLETIEQQVNFKRWFCGHYHTDSVLDDKHTVLYNDIIEFR